jgi:glutamine amidotransferase
MIVVIDYEAGNLYNVGHALKYLGVDFCFSGEPQVVAEADKVILPGVGSARSAMESLRERGLTEVLTSLRVPFLGICLGLQLLYERSEEDNTPCLGVLPGTIRRFDNSVHKVPQIGWNQVDWLDQPAESELYSAMRVKLLSPGYFYFVHSYYAPVEKETWATTTYGVQFSSAVCRAPYIGLQFHPERSGKSGLQLLRNFAEL